MNKHVNKGRMNAVVGVIVDHWYVTQTAAIAHCVQRVVELDLGSASSPYPDSANFYCNSTTYLSVTNLRLYDPEKHIKCRVCMAKYVVHNT